MRSAMGALQTHLNEREAGVVFAEKLTCNNATNSQELLGGPGEPIQYIALRHHAVLPMRHGYSGELCVLDL